MSDVPLVTDASATAEQARVLAAAGASRGRVPDLFRALVHCPGGAERVSALGAYLRYESTLPKRLLELLILAMSGRWNCAYERAQHAPLARAQGVSETALNALARGEVPDDLAGVERQAVQYVLHLARNGVPDPEGAAALRDAFGDHGLVEIHLVAGYYSLLALSLNGLGVPVEDVS